MTALVQTLGWRETARASIITDVTLVILGSLVVAALAQISIGERVPFTGQTLGVLLVGASLGAVRGGSALLLYLGEGAAGLPVFAQGKSGLAYLASADPAHVTGGYLWGFVLAAFVVGLLAERGWDRSVGSAIGAMFIGEVIVFACGVPWLARALDMSLAQALAVGLYPFVVWDAVKVLAAAGALPGAWRLIGGLPGERPRA